MVVTAARLLCLLALLTGAGVVQALESLASASVESCRLLDGSDAVAHPPGRLPALDCEATSWPALDPQGQLLWVRTGFDVTPEQLEQPLAVYLFAKASSRVYLNGRLIGANGVPALTPDSETAGRMDASVYLPPDLLRARDNELVLEMSSQQGWLQLAHPIHFVGIGEYGEARRYIQRFSSLGLVMLGCFILGVVYFGVVSVGASEGGTYRLFALMSGLAGLQLWAELSRAYFSYAYPLHDLRLLAVTALSTAFGVCLLLYTVRRFAAPPQRLHWLYAGVLLTVICVILAPGFDARTTLGTWIPVTVSAIAALQSWFRGRSGDSLITSCVLAGFSAIILLTLSYFHELLYFLLVALLLGYLFIQQGIAFRQQREQRLQDQDIITSLQLKLEQRQETEQPTVLTISLGDAVERVASSGIAYCKADGDYSQICLVDERELLFSGNLKKLQAALPGTFLRVHRSYLVNLEQVSRLQRGEAGTGGVLSLVNGKTVPVSRRLMAEVREAFLAGDVPDQSPAPKTL